MDAFDPIGSKTLAVQPEGAVYRKTVDGVDYLVKTRDVSMQHEYNVGIKLNSFDSRYFCSTYDHFQKNGTYHLVTEFFDGEHVDHTNYRDVVPELFLFLLSIRDRIRFTHYDLHRGNYLVRRRPAPLEKEFATPYGPLSVESRYEIRIVDFGYSYVDGIDVDCVETDTDRLLMGKVPVVYDPDYDLVTLFALFRFYYENTEHDPHGTQASRVADAADWLPELGYLPLGDGHVVELLASADTMLRRGEPTPGRTPSRLTCFGSMAETDKSVDEALSDGDDPERVLYAIVSRKKFEISQRNTYFFVRAALAAMLGRFV